MFSVSDVVAVCISSIFILYIAPHPGFFLSHFPIHIVGTPQIRRVLLSRIQSLGRVSYTSLVRVAVECAYPNIKTDVNEHDCTFTYYDIDNDCVTIASTEELIDAIGQFSSTENPVLRITTDVKRKEGVPARSASDTDPGAARASPPVISKSNQLQNIVESCVSVLTAAVVTLQNQIAEVNNPHATQDKTEASGSAVPTVPNNDAENVTNEAVENNGVQDSDESPSVQSNQDDIPFIHGRHTCDGCLCTPVIGTRYHSTNLPDYDLCAKCRNNYKGTEIQFEAQQLGTLRMHSVQQFRTLSLRYPTFFVD